MIDAESESASWIITRLADGYVAETYDPVTAVMASVDERLKVEPVREYLERINREIKQENTNV